MYLLLFAIWMPWNQDPYHKAMTELHNGHPELSRRTLKDALAQTGEQRYMIALAWVALNTGDFAEARRLAQYVLDSNPPDRTRAASLYVLGWAATRDGSFTLALESLTEALAVFSDLRQDQDIYNTHLALAYYNLQSPNLAKADAHLALAFSLKDLSKTNLSYLYSLKSKIEFLKGNGRAALNFANRELEESKLTGPSYKLISAYQSLAFFQAALGDYGLALETIKLAARVQGPELTEELIAWRELTLLLLRRCDKRGKANQALITSYLTKTNDACLEMFLHQVESMKCK
jgi:tetratricopeptide (TPR) repeat protein